MSLLAEFIKRFEGYAKRLANGDCVPYLCSAGVLTLGFGATQRGVHPNARWTREQAEARLQEDLAAFSKGVLALSPGLAEEAETKRVAAISFAYNCGLGNYRASTFRRRVEAKDWHGAAVQLKRWDKAAGKVVRGLILRRSAEAALLLAG